MFPFGKNRSPFLISVIHTGAYIHIRATYTLHGTSTSTCRFIFIALVRSFALYLQKGPLLLNVNDVVDTAADDDDDTDEKGKCTLKTAANFMCMLFIVIIGWISRKNQMRKHIFPSHPAIRPGDLWCFLIHLYAYPNETAKILKFIRHTLPSTDRILCVSPKNSSKENTGIIWTSFFNQIARIFCFAGLSSESKRIQRIWGSIEFVRTQNRIHSNV